MNRRWESKTNHTLVDIIGKATGADIDLSEVEEDMISGASEK